MIYYAVLVQWYSITPVNCTLFYTFSILYSVLYCIISKYYLGTPFKPSILLYYRCLLFSLSVCANL